MIKTLTQLRSAFWSAHPEIKDQYRVTYRQNQYCAYIRILWCDFVDSMSRDNQITEKLAQRATL